MRAQLVQLSQCEDQGHGADREQSPPAAPASLTSEGIRDPHRGLIHAAQLWEPSSDPQAPCRMSPAHCQRGLLSGGTQMG